MDSFQYDNQSSNLKNSKSNSNIVKIPEIKPLDINLEEAKNNLKEGLDEFRNININTLIDSDLVYFEEKMEKIIQNKKILEEKISSGISDFKIAEEYQILLAFFEKYVEIVNDKLIENIESNMILKFNMKDILEINDTNKKNITVLMSYLLSNKLETEENNKINEEIKDFEKNIEDNEYIKEKICTSLEKNLKIKTFLKRMIIKFISNNDTKGIRELHIAFKHLEIEKQEFETKAKKFQEHLISSEKEKQDLTCRLEDALREIDKLKLLCKEKNDKIVNLEKLLKQNNFQNIKRSESEDNYQNIKVKKNNRLNDTDYINLKKDNKRSDMLLTKIDLFPNSINNNYISINLQPRNEPQNVISSKNNATFNEKNNQKRRNKRAKSKSPNQNTKLRDIDKLLESHLNEIFNKRMNINPHKPKEQTNQAQNFRTPKHKHNEPPKNPKAKGLAALVKSKTAFYNENESISTVNNNNDNYLNSSELDILENVINLDGITTNDRKKSIFNEMILGCYQKPNKIEEVNDVNKIVSKNTDLEEMIN